VNNQFAAEMLRLRLSMTTEIGQLELNISCCPAARLFLKGCLEWKSPFLATGLFAAMAQHRG